MKTNSLCSLIITIKRLRQRFNDVIVETGSQLTRATEWDKSTCLGGPVWYDVIYSRATTKTGHICDFELNEEKKYFTIWVVEGIKCERFWERRPFIIISYKEGAHDYKV